MSLEVSLKNFLDSNGVKYVAGRQSFISTCLNPKCGKENHLYIRKSDGRSVCFKCGSRWSWMGVVSAISRCSYKDAHQVLYGHGAGDVIGNIFSFNLAREEKSEGAFFVPNPIKMGPDFIPYHKSSRAMKYLRDRGIIDPTILTGYDIRYHNEMDAVVFPVVGCLIDNNVATMHIFGWQARKISPKDDEPRLLTMPGFDKSKFFLNHHRAMVKKKIILVEGPFDCLHADTDPLYGAVAALGKGISGDQIKMILESPCEEVYIGLDDDAAEEVYDVVDRIGSNKRVFRIKPPQHRDDFGECEPEEVKWAIRNAISTSSLFLEAHFKEWGG